jgi:anti-sigma factor RsiW
MANQDHNPQGEQQETLTHDQARALLPAYVSDMVLRTGRPELAAQVERHIRSCEACAAEAAELADLLHEAASGELPSAPDYPPFSLDFLRRKRREEPPPPSSHPWSLDDLGRLVVSFSHALLGQIRTPVAATMLRSGERRTAGPPLYQYDQAKFSDPAAPPQPPLTISVFGVGADPALIDVVVRVGAAGRRAADLSGSEVTLTLGSEVRQAQTDRLGYAYFRNLPANVLEGMEVTVAATAGRSG